MTPLGDEPPNQKLNLKGKRCPIKSEKNVNVK